MKQILFILALVLYFLQGNAQQAQLGTEIWIEPGYTKVQIMDLAKIATESGFEDIRIFMMWTHVEPKLDEWNFDIYDWMFEACEKYKLRLQVTLNPNQPAWHYGREFWGSIHSHAIFSNEAMLPQAAKYIKKVVERYKSSSALNNWWLMNEPDPMDGENQYVLSGFRKAMKEKYGEIDTLNKLWNTSFKSFDKISNVRGIYNAEWAAAMPFYDWKLFCNQHLTDFQHWVRDEVLKSDTTHPFHTNPASYLDFYPRQDASAWRSFTNSMGFSIHPTWHFGMFSPDQYAMAVAATCELGRSVAYPNPFWVSELSGGNSMYHLCPRAEEVAQWTWIGIAQGAKKIIYWLLNARPSGNESGEWAMLNFQNKPTKRLEAATNIIQCLNRNSIFFNRAKPIESNITILLSRETSLTYERKGYGDIHNQAAMGCYEALSERGIAAKIEQTQDFCWAKSTGKVLILPDMYTIPSILVDSIKTFLSHNNKLIVLGPSGYFNEYEDCQFLKFPFKDEFGAEPEEIQSLEDDFQIPSVDGNKPFEVYKILGTISNHSAKPICTYNGDITGVRKKNEESEVVWIPSSIEVGAWKYGNESLSEFLSDEVLYYSASQPFVFKDKTNKVGMQTMTDGTYFLTVITNGLNSVNKVNLSNRTLKKPMIVYCTDAGRKEINIEKEIVLSSRECVVLLWK